MHEIWIRRKDASVASMETAAIAGPVFSVAAILVALASSVTSVDVEPAFLASLAGFLLLSIPFGFALAIIPCLLATHLLLTIARQGDGSLNPLPWLLVGVVAAGALGYAVDRHDGALVMALTGGVLALFARMRTLGRACEDG